MKIFSCADVDTNCNVVTRGETDEAVMEQAMTHVRQVHPDKLAELQQQTTNEQFLDLMRSMIKEE